MELWTADPATSFYAQRQKIPIHQRDESLTLPTSQPPQYRLGYLDWMRGLAASIMLQGHVFDGWVRTQDRAGEWFWISQFLGGFPAPIFLFLVGVSLAIVHDKMREKGVPLAGKVKRVIRRSAWMMLVAYAFRLEQFLSWYPHSNWHDVFRVDALNCIAVCTLLVGLTCAMFRSRRVNSRFAGAATVLIVALTPFIYPIGMGIPDAVRSYLDGAGHPSYFGVIPWIAFTLGGAAFGCMLLDARACHEEDRFFTRVAVSGVVLYGFGTAASQIPSFKYGFFDYSITSPYFFMVRLGTVLLVSYGAYRWSCRPASVRWSPLKILGQSSLIVYWVHIELVYGRAFHEFSGALRIQEAALHVLWLIPAMLILSWGSKVQWRRRAVSL